MNSKNSIFKVTSFQDLVSVKFQEERNAACWSRELKGDYLEIIEKIQMPENIVELSMQQLQELDLTEQGQLARDFILRDFQLLQDYGASPVLNVIQQYQRDESFPFFPTDVYSYHVDRSPIESDTFLCTYYGESSEILPNAQAIKKINIPGVRKELQNKHQGSEEEFDLFLKEHFFDLHYESRPFAQTINCGLGNLWRLAVDQPFSKSLPCIHRAPIEKPGQKRLLMIC